MIDGLPIPIEVLTPSALLGVAVLMLLSGRLWTNAAFREKCKESNQWREAYLNEREARQTSDNQATELLELARTTHSLIAAVFRNSQVIRESGGPDGSSSQAI